MVFDLERARNETPGCHNVLHFNNAGASLMPERVLDAVISHLELEAQIGGYEAADQAIDDIEHTYDAVAALIGCSRDEVALVENATRAWDMAFYAIPFAPGDRILTGMSEYASNYIAFLQIAKKAGAVVEAIPNDAHGQISVEALRKAIDERVKLIAVTHVPTNGGLVNPIAEIGKVAREADILYLVDACQSVGQMPIDVKQIGCDILSATGRKYLRGPRGTGFLYVRRGILEQLEPPLLDLHAATWFAPDQYEIRSDARRFENWESNIAGKIGLGIAIDYALEWGLDAIWRRVKTLAYQLRTHLSPIPGVIVRDRGITQCGIVTFTVEDQDPDDIRKALAQFNINVSVTRRASTLLDMEVRGLESMVRASVHYYNSEEEIERFCKTLASLVV
ncbi:MAG TPA: aminotransferase class V-fold PLP-dependent enzyme [Ktedonobacteraceae bacterium]|jgi:selenocysteine lyase/cysteine desulfurase|nr:aminotransferase class V-fold PLP-dependent enzyme [Ktedonobacteraceae bacterium]